MEVEAEGPVVDEVVLTSKTLKIDLKIEEMTSFLGYRSSRRTWRASNIVHRL